MDAILDGDRKKRSEIPEGIFAHQNKYITLSKKCSYSGFFWSVFSRIRDEYGEMPNISPHSIRMRENMDRKNVEFGQFSRSGRQTQ